MSDNDLSNGEIARSLQRLEKSQDRQTETLEQIKEQTTRTNGRVTVLEREVKDLKGRHYHKRESDPELSVTVSPRMWKFFVALAAAVSPLIVELIRRWAAQP